MGDYNRSTRELAFQEIPSTALQVLEKHIGLHSLGNVTGDVLMCVESRSEKIKKGLFGGPGPKTVVSYVVATKNWLFEIISSDGGPFHAVSARLADVTVGDYETSLFHAMVPDTGVNVDGSFTDASERGSRFIGLGKDEAGEKFKTLLIQAVQEAKM